MVKVQNTEHLDDAPLSLQLIVQGLFVRIQLVPYQIFQGVKVSRPDDVEIHQGS